MPKGENSGGRMPAEQHGRPAQAGGKGRFSKRHDLEGRNVPYLHGSDLQYGEVSEMEQAQSALGPRTQQSASGGTPQRGGAPMRDTAPVAQGVPDPISFFSGRKMDQSKALNIQGEFQMNDWLPFAERAMNGASSSSLMRRLFIRQLRNVNMASQRIVEMDLNERDDALLNPFGE